MDLAIRTFDILYQLDWLSSVRVIKTNELDIYMFENIQSINDYVKIIDEFIKKHIYSTDSRLSYFHTEIKAFDREDSRHRIIETIGNYINSKYKLYPIDIDFNTTVIINIKNTNINQNYVLVVGGPQLFYFP